MNRMINFIQIVLCIMILTSCPQPETESTKLYSLLWLGSFSYPPENPKAGWAYYDNTQKMSFIYDGLSWQTLAQDGKSLIWKGELSEAPFSPEENWAYYNKIDGNSYIYSENQWHYLAKAGRDGAEGILLWLGEFDSHPGSAENGYAYYNSTDGKSYIYYNGQWQTLSENGKSMTWKGALSSAPTNPQPYWCYYNTTEQTSYIWTGSRWDILAASAGGNTTITVPVNWQGDFPSAPVNPLVGWCYYNTSLKASYIWDGTVWQKIAADGKDGTVNGVSGILMIWKGALSAAPAAPATGWAYYNTTDGKTYIYEGRTWQVVGGSGYDYDYLYVSVSCNGQNTFQSYQTKPLRFFDAGEIPMNSPASVTISLSRQSSDGDNTLILTGTPPVQFSGTNADMLSLVSVNEYTKNMFSITVNFTIKTEGIQTAVISVPNSSPDCPDFSFTITGRGAKWPKIFDGGEGDGADYLTDGCLDSNGNLYLIGCGYEIANNYSGFDWWIKKLDSKGNEITEGWDKKINHFETNIQNYDSPTRALIDSENNLIVTGIVRNGSLPNGKTYKFDPVGNQIFCINYEGIPLLDRENNLYILLKDNTTVKFSPSGEASCTYTATGTPVISNDLNVLIYNNQTLTLFDPGAEMMWSTSVYSESNVPLIIKYAAFDTDGNLYITGYGENLIDEHSDQDAFIKKFNSAGEEVPFASSSYFDWGNSNAEYGSGILLTTDKIILFGNGTDLISGSSKEDLWVKVFNYNGTLLHEFEIDNYTQIIKDSVFYINITGTVGTVVQYNLTTGVKTASYTFTAPSYHVYTPKIAARNNDIYLLGYINNSETAFDWFVYRLSQ